jgi:hypothetical protein
VINRKETVNIDAPLGPIYLPNNPAVSELSNGKKIKIRYIFKQHRILTYKMTICFDYSQSKAPIYSTYRRPTPSSIIKSIIAQKPIKSNELKLTHQEKRYMASISNTMNKIAII